MNLKLKNTYFPWFEFIISIMSSNLNQSSEKNRLVTVGDHENGNKSQNSIEDSYLNVEYLDCKYSLFEFLCCLSAIYLICCIFLHLDDKLGDENDNVEEKMELKKHRKHQTKLKKKN